MGRGAEFEDLEQEACLAMLDLIPRCPEGVPLALHLIRQLPGRVRRSAERLRRQSLGGALFGPDLDDLAEVLPCPRESRIAQAVEAADLLERLAPEERALALRLAAGDSQGEIARDRGVTQQAVSARIRRLRARVAAALRED
jgi:DNA-directed RNA polymerase specialized sigma24 family protein